MNSPCILRRWKRGDPKKLFLMMLSRLRQGDDEEVDEEGCRVDAPCPTPPWPPTPAPVATSLPPEAVDDAEGDDVVVRLVGDVFPLPLLAW